jgi:hypothetical protein
MAEPNKPDDVIEEEQLRAWALRVDGWELTEIAKKMGLSLSTVKRRINDAILNRELPNREAAKMVSVARQDRYLRIIHDYLDRDLEPADAARLLSEARQLDREQRRVLGTDEPTRTHATVLELSGGDEPAPEVVALIERLEEESA